MAGKKNGKNTKKSSDGSSGKGFALLLILGLIIKLIWWILAALVLVAAFFVVRAILRENRRRKQRHTEYLAALSARADEQNEWVMQGDDRGVYGTQGARLMEAVRSGRRWVRPEPATPRPALIEPPRPWSNARVSAMTAGVVSVALVGAFHLVHHPAIHVGKEAQITLPFSDLRSPQALAVDVNGAVYVADTQHDRVLKLAQGSAEQVELPFPRLSHPQSVAVDSRGDVYVSGFNQITQHSTVMELPAGAATYTELPFDLPGSAGGVAVDGDGAVYVTEDNSDGGLFKLAPGATSPIEMVKGDFNSVAVDSGGNIYLTSSADDPNVLILPAGGQVPRPMPFKAVSLASGVALDSAGSVYVSDAWSSMHPVYKLAAGSTNPSTLPFKDLSFPDSFASGVAVDGSGNVYVSDSKHNRVVELFAQ